MSVYIAIRLFALAESELDDYELTAEGFREFASNLVERLDHAAKIAYILRDDGWSIRIVKSNLEARHTQVATYTQAVERLKRLELDQDDVTDIAEWSDSGERMTPA